MLRDLNQWLGVIFVTIAIVATLWLAGSGQLNLYIHPRYNVFSVLMAVIGLLFVIAACAMRLTRIGRRGRQGDNHEHDDDHELTDGSMSPARRRALRTLSIVGVSLVSALALGLIVLPPATLTSATANQRAMNSTALDGVDGAVTGAADLTDASVAISAAFEKFTVLDWASVLRQTSDPSFYADKPVRVVGFVVPDPDAPDDVFYVSRFIVTCCAVDAQPVGVPVYLEGWADAYAVDEWVEVSGEFGANPSRSSAQPVALRPLEIEKVGQPEEPYLF